jgi:hypothetical protein
MAGSPHLVAFVSWGLYHLLRDTSIPGGGIKSHSARVDGFRIIPHGSTAKHRLHVEA